MTSGYVLIQSAKTVDTPVDTLPDQLNRMRLQETLDTFWYLIAELDSLWIAYVAFATRVFVNASFMGEEAAQYVEDEKVDGVFFGIPWVADPDFAKRLEKGKRLEEIHDTHWTWRDRDR